MILTPAIQLTSLLHMLKNTIMRALRGIKEALLRSVGKVSQLYLVEQFLYRYMITVAGIERSCPWGLDPVN
ncbi:MULTISPECIES: hypothetical protein [unclassified Peribacillus]|uniref:hypothetical protein n=1 Tax=unclassified Peribacillus TaxID=2675266 RepID=UPI0036DC5D8D